MYSAFESLHPVGQALLGGLFTWFVTAITLHDIPEGLVGLAVGAAFGGVIAGTQPLRRRHLRNIRQDSYNR